MIFLTSGTILMEVNLACSASKSKPWIFVFENPAQVRKKVVDGYGGYYYFHHLNGHNTFYS